MDGSDKRVEMVSELLTLAEKRPFGWQAIEENVFALEQGLNVLNVQCVGDADLLLKVVGARVMLRKMLGSRNSWVSSKDEFARSELCRELRGLRRLLGFPNR
jgi:hypothetical protein